MFKEQRSHPREPIQLPLKLGDGPAVSTRNISASGMYVELPADCPLPGPVEFEMQLPEAGLKFTAQVEVVRVERRLDGTGVALKLISPKLEPLAE